MRKYELIPNDGRKSFCWSATTGRHINAFCGLNKAAYMAQSEYSPKTNTIEGRALPNGVIMRVFDSVGYFCFQKGSVSTYVETRSAGQVALPHVLCVCRSGGQGRPVFPLHPAAPCRWLSPCAVLCVRRAGDTAGAGAAPAANGSIK